MAVDVRRPVLRDVDELARINIDTWCAAYAGIVPQTRLDSMDPEAYRLRWIENVTTGRPGVEFRVAEFDGRLAAYAIAGPYRPQEDAEPEVMTGLAELYAIYVDPPMQGRGAAPPCTTRSCACLLRRATTRQPCGSSSTARRVVAGTSDAAGGPTAPSARGRPATGNCRSCGCDGAVQQLLPRGRPDLGEWDLTGFSPRLGG
jgi:GNAT superfamily N-acetyltransferase